MSCDTLSKTKKHILTVQIVSVIIINFLKLKEMYSQIKSNKLVSKIHVIKDVSTFFYDVLTFNIFSLFCNSVPMYFKLKKIAGSILNKFRNKKE
jgi:hypothetical protein